MLGSDYRMRLPDLLLELSQSTRLFRNQSCSCYPLLVLGIYKSFLFISGEVIPNDFCTPKKCLPFFFATSQVAYCHSFHHRRCRGITTSPQLVAEEVPERGCLSWLLIFRQPIGIIQPWGLPAHLGVQHVLVGVVPVTRLKGARTAGTPDSKVNH